MDDLSIKNYFQQLVVKFGQGWNRFWYTPTDLLPLSLIRIVVGIIALYVLLTYTNDIAFFFKEGGLLPVELTAEYLAEDAQFNPSTLSYLTYLDSPAALHMAHWIGAAVLVLFTIGYYSRITSVLALIVTLSYIHRAPLLTSEIESVLAMLQFYLCLGPCGGRLSADNWLAKRRAKDQPAQLEELASRKSFAAMVAIRLIQVHLSIVILMMGFAKLSGPGEITGGQWYDPWGTGEAVWWLIAKPQSRIIEGLTFLRDYPRLVAAWTHAIVLFELAFPILVWNRLARPLMLTCGILIWSSLALISGVGVLFVLLIVASISFYSPALLHRWLDRSDSTAESAPNVATA